MSPGPQDDYPGVDRAIATTLGAVEPVSVTLLESHRHHWESPGPCIWPGPWTKAFCPEVKANQLCHCVQNQTLGL